jgi:ankyrin repeat protein
MFKKIFVFVYIFLALKDLKAGPFHPFFIRSYHVVARSTLERSLRISDKIFYRDEIENLKKAIQRGFDINSKNKDEQTALMLAAKIGHKEVIKILCDAGAYVDLEDKNGLTALHIASKHGSVEGVQELLYAKAIVNVTTYHGWTPLFMAVYHRHPEIVKLLIDAGANVNDATFEGKTPLSTAKKNGDFDIQKCLFEAGAKKIPRPICLYAGDKIEEFLGFF